MTVKDFGMLVQAQIQHLRKVRNEIDLTIRALRSLLPDKQPDDRRQFYVLDPNGKRERHD